MALSKTLLLFFTVLCFFKVAPAQPTSIVGAVGNAVGLDGTALEAARLAGSITGTLTELGATAITTKQLLTKGFQFANDDVLNMLIATNEAASRIRDALKAQGRVAAYDAADAYVNFINSRIQKIADVYTGLNADVLGVANAMNGLIQLGTAVGTPLGALGQLASGLAAVPQGLATLAGDAINGAVGDLNNLLKAAFTTRPLQSRAESLYKQYASKLKVFRDALEGLNNALTGNVDPINFLKNAGNVLWWIGGQPTADLQGVADTVGNAVKILQGPFDAVFSLFRNGTDPTVSP